jgi:hypothetical protein
MQLRFGTSLTAEEYVRCRAWREATLAQCPVHPEGGCSFARHGTYRRVHPTGTQIPRWYCPEGHCTFSLLPDCFASRLPGSLHMLDQIVAEIERARSIESAANTLRTDDITLPSAIRWIQRRFKLVHIALTALLALLPERFLRCHATVLSLRDRLRADYALPRVREIAADYLEAVPPPLGFSPYRSSKDEPNELFQHDKGPDPPLLTVYATQRLKFV